MLAPITTRGKTGIKGRLTWLKSVQRGDVTPDLPKVQGTDGKLEGGTIIFGSNAKKNQHF